jgi:energy-coupling factor transporter ATP-binding protein EcfA2
MELYHNPFRYGADSGPGHIVGRKDEIACVESVIRNGMRLFLIGPRGFGKTSILRAAQANMSQKGAVVLYVNAESCPDVGGLIGQIVVGAATQMSDETEQGILKAGGCFSHLRPQFRFGADGHEVSVSINTDLAAHKYRQMEVLAHTLDSLDRLAETLPKDRPVAFIIDEFSILMARFGVTAEAQIRSVVQRHQNLGYIFAGSNVGLMMDMTGRHSRPFYNGADIRYLRPVPVAEFGAWLREQFQGSGYEVDGDEPVLRILSLADDVPYNVQMLAHNCWNELRSESQPKLTVDLVESVFKQTVQHLTPSFKQAWSRFTPLQRRTLTAVLGGNGRRMKAPELARSIDRPESSVRSTLRTLYTRGILWDDVSHKGVRVRPEDPFFAHWIRMNCIL